MRAYLQRCHPAHLFLLAVLVVAFVTYATFRQRFVGATDWYGYYQQGLLLQQGRIALPVDLPVADFPIAVPMGYVALGDQAVPQYPPGFPLLLALGGFFVGPLLVPALIGVASILLLYGIVRDLTDPWTGAVFALLWAFFPIVAYGSTYLMSDLTAATGVLAAWWLYRRDRVALSALALGFSFGVRPTNILFLLALAWPLWRERRLVRYGLWLAVPCVLFALYNHLVYGAPWRTGYTGMGNDLQPEVFQSHFLFYLRETLRQCGWPVIALAALGLTVRHRDRWICVVWFVPFLVFYAFWWAGGDRWWWTRFLLPAYGAIFILAALGLARLRDTVQRLLPNPAWRPVAAAVLLGALALTPLYYLKLTRREGDVWVRLKGVEYLEAVHRIGLVAPPGSYVGSIEFGGALRLYSDLQPFLSTFPTSPDLVAEAHRRGRRVFLMVEPWHRDQDVIRRMLARFPSQRLADIPVWWGVQVHELRPEATR